MFVSNDEALAGRLKRTSAQFMDRLSRLQADSELHYQTIKSKVMASSLLVQMIKESGRNQIYGSLPSKQGSRHRDQWGNEKENTDWALGISGCLKCAKELLHLSGPGYQDMRYYFLGGLLDKYPFLIS